MTTVVLKPLHHGNQEWIGIFYENHPDLNRSIKEQASAKWSQINKCWYIPLQKESYHKLSAALAGKAKIDRSALDNYLSGRKQNNLKKNILAPTLFRSLKQPAI